MMSEEKFSYEQTRHLFDQDQDGATCQHVWRLQENLVNQHQITRVCVVCHASNGFPDSYDFLRGNYTNAENENLRHYLELKELEQRLAEARALLEWWVAYADLDRDWAPTEVEHNEKLAQYHAFLAQ